MVFLFQQTAIKPASATRRDPLAEMIEKQGLKQGDVFVLKYNTKSGNPDYVVCGVISLHKDKSGYSMGFDASKKLNLSYENSKNMPEGAYIQIDSRKAFQKGSDLNGFYIQKLQEGQSVYIATGDFKDEPVKAKIKRIDVTPTTGAISPVEINLTLYQGKKVLGYIPASDIISIEPIVVKAPEKKGF